MVVTDCWSLEHKEVMCEMAITMTQIEQFRFARFRFNTT
jgi:hypothetical protein